MTKMVSTQSQFDLLKTDFPQPSDYRIFTKAGYYFNPKSRLEKLDMSNRDALPRATPGRARWRIFEALKTGTTVESFNQKTKAMGLGAEWDGDIFYAVHKGFARLED